MKETIANYLQFVNWIYNLSEIINICIEGVYKNILIEWNDHIKMQNIKRNLFLNKNLTN